MASTEEMDWTADGAEEQGSSRGNLETAAAERQTNHLSRDSSKREQGRDETKEGLVDDDLEDDDEIQEAHVQDFRICEAVEAVGHAEPELELQEGNVSNKNVLTCSTAIVLYNRLPSIHYWCFGLSILVHARSYCTGA